MWREVTMEDIQDQTKVDSNIGEEKDNQSIFEQRFHDLMNRFGEDCENNKVETAISIAIHPEESKPIIFVRGNEYDVAQITAMVLRSLKAEINNNLTIN